MTTATSQFPHCRIDIMHIVSEHMSVFCVAALVLADV